MGACVMDLDDGVIMGPVWIGSGRDVVVVIDSVGWGRSKLDGGWFAVRGCVVILVLCCEGGKASGGECGLIGVTLLLFC